MMIQMRNFVAVGALVISLATFGAREKAVVYVDRFIYTVGENCRMTPNDAQVLQNRIVGNVTSSRRYEVVERENLDRVQKELELVDAGMTEGKAPESNRLKAAGYVITGTVQQYRTYREAAAMGGLRVDNVFGIVELQIRILNIMTSRILNARTVTVKVPASKVSTYSTASSRNLELETLTAALEEAAKEVVAALNAIAFPVYVLDADKKFVSGNIADAQVTVGEIWEIWMRGRAIKDPDTEEILGYKEKLVCTVRVSRPGPKLTKFEYVNPADAEEIESLLDAEKKLEMRRAPKTVSDGQKPTKKPRLSDLDN